MARKKNAAPAKEPEATAAVQEPAQEVAQAPQEAAPAPEVQEPAQEPEDTTAPPEAPEKGHLDPAQFEDWEDAALQELAQDMGLDPAAYEDREALIAAIVEVPVTPGPPEQEPEPITADTPFPCKATVVASLAVLRRTIGPGTAEMLKPVATLKQGTEITVIGYRDGNVQLANGLWIKADYLATV